MNRIRNFSLLALLSTLLGCTGLPQGVTPVSHFDASRYLGKWYEIARLDNRFERGLENITADYSRRDDGGIRVLNQGYSPTDKAWKQAEGKAYFVEGEDQGFLKVSFFGPFYASYIVFDLDTINYQYAMVSGYDKSYLWLLARTPTVSSDLLERFKTQSKQMGFDLKDLILVKQNQHQP